LAKFVRNDMLGLILKGVLTPGQRVNEPDVAGCLARLRRDSLLVNTSRSASMDVAAVVKALGKGRPGFAALDVFDVEPLPANDPLRRLTNVLLTPHLGFMAEPVFKRFAEGLTECLGAWLDEKPLLRAVAA
jgi:phosphoglycerate dehydrogenase-like enzyme